MLTMLCSEIGQCVLSCPVNRKRLENQFLFNGFRYICFCICIISFCLFFSLILAKLGDLNVEKSNFFIQIHLNTHRLHVFPSFHLLRSTMQHIPFFFISKPLSLTADWVMELRCHKHDGFCSNILKKQVASSCALLSNYQAVILVQIMSQSVLRELRLVFPRLSRERK